MWTRTWITGLMVMAMVAVIPLSAAAGDRNADGSGKDAPVSEQPADPIDVVTDRAVTDATDRPADRVKDRPTDRVTDRRTDRITDRPTDRITDRPRDRIIDRCDHRRVAAAHDRCVTDRFPHDFNIRKLIYRLIHAGEWAKLVRLLHYLGWI